MARQRVRMNLFGLASVLVGLTAWAATKYNIAGYSTNTIALAGICVGVVAFLLAIATKRWGAASAMLGVLVSAGAIGYVSYKDGKFDSLLAKFHHHDAPAPNAIPPSPAPTPPSSSGADERHVPNIFDDPSMSNGPHGKSPAGASGSADVNPPVAPAPAPAPAPAAPSVDVPAGPSVEQAKAHLAAAMSQVEHSLVGDPVYASASAELAGADQKRQAALAASGSGSPEVLAASSAWLEAKARLNKVVEAAAARDPSVAAAQRELAGAQAAAGRAGKSR